MRGSMTSRVNSYEQHGRLRDIAFFRSAKAVPFARVFIERYFAGNCRIEELFFALAR